MQLIARIPIDGARRARRVRLRRRRPERTPPPLSDLPPQDRATYNCSCGYVFEADVTTSVHCPHCRVELAW